MSNAKRKTIVELEATPAAVPGRLRGGARRRTIYDIADIAGVSAVTVSRALNGGSCSPATRERIQKLARQLGYEPDAAAQALAMRRRKHAPRDPRLDVPATVPQVWQSYAEMMLRLIRPPS